MNFDQFHAIVKPYTMTTELRIKALFNALETVHTQNIQGDIVEVGVWRGGNILGTMCYFYTLGDNRRRFWLYDTFEGMTAPSDVDVDYTGVTAKDQFENIKCVADLNDVKNVLFSFPPSQLMNISFIVGDVRKTLALPNATVPDQIAVLRLDTDFYDSTKIELETLWPMVAAGGFLIVDDYGHWQGCRKACDEYFIEQGHEKELAQTPVMIDYTGRLYQKKHSRTGW